jgi:thymidylate synthase (FAD)
VPRAVAEEAEAIVGQALPVHDHGFVRLVDYMGNDAAIVAAARVSYGAGTKTLRSDRGLIRYLMRHQHTTPFEMVELKFHIKAPIFVARQWGRHRTASTNEVSGRYSELAEEFYLPRPAAVRPQSTTNRQGRADEPFPPEEAERAIADMRELQAAAYATYRRHLAAGMARELARISLPLALYTEWYWKINLHNLFHFLELRTDPHAQFEIRLYGEAICLIAQMVAPVAYEAFEDYIRDAVRLSGVERELVARALRGEPLGPDDWKRLGKRERAEFARKFGLDPDALAPRIAAVTQNGV